MGLPPRLSGAAQGFTHALRFCPPLDWGPLPCVRCAWPGAAAGTDVRCAHGVPTGNVNENLGTYSVGDLGVLTRLQARMLLSACTGRDIWPVDLCRQQGIPAEWIQELADCFESGFRSDRQTIYYEQRVVNQFQGVHDLQLAYRLGEFLGVDTQRVGAGLGDPVAQVRAIQEAADED